MWWLIPLICIVLCFLMCRLFRRRADAGQGHFCGWRVPSRNDADLEALWGEIRELKEEIGKMKGKQGG
jgi:hypothetical protein